MKNLSSYNQDLSVPRKKDLDALETKVNGKQDAITGGASTITTSNLTANRALVSNGSGKVAVSPVTSTELGYLDGVTSNVQTQLGDKQPTITVNGIVQGDGSGNLSAVETVEAETIELNAAAVGLGNVDNVKQYSATNPPPYPVTSVNGETGNVTVDNITLGVSGAAVGQIAKITAVDADGKPTAWSPVDMPSGGGDAWEKIADVAFTADTPVYEVANFGVYRKVKVLMSRTAYVSGLNKNVWFHIRTIPSGTVIAAIYLNTQYGYLTWEVNAEVDAFVYVSRNMANNRVSPSATEKTVAILPPAEPGSLKFNIEFTDTSVIQAGDTVAVYGVKR